MQVRTATSDDLAMVVSLTRNSRGQLAKWSPVYFHPARGADDSHAAFLEFILASDEHDAFVLTEGHDVVGFFTRIPQESHLWIDDLCVDTPIRWAEAVPAIVEWESGRWVTCVSSSDGERSVAMKATGLTLASSYYARATKDLSPLDSIGSVTLEDSLAAAPAHTFGGRAFSPTAPGALVVTDEIGGYVVGSPSVTPPIYDPGGPTCVVDRIVGDDRPGLLALALGVARGRGDAQLVVVCDAGDADLASLLEGSGFKDEVHLLGT